MTASLASMSIVGDQSNIVGWVEDNKAGQKYTAGLDSPSLNRAKHRSARACFVFSDQTSFNLKYSSRKETD